MKKQFLSFLFLLSLSLVVSVSAQKVQTPKPDLVEQNLRRHVAYLASDKLEGRRTGEKGATFAAGYVANRFATAKLKGGLVKNGKRIFMQPFPYKPRNEKGEVLPDAKEVNAYNVIGILEGTDPILKNEAIVIGAHYDHLGKGGMGSLAANSTEIHHGADDNASGTSALIELARTFAQAKNNKRTLIFIAFGGEEEGLLGSRYYVNNPVFPIDKTVAMINMDMIGRLKDDKLTVGGIGTASEWKSVVNSKNEKGETRFIERENLQKGSFRGSNTISEEEAKKLIEAKAAIPLTSNGILTGILQKSLFFQLQLNEDGFGPSDHASFYGKQIPVLFFFTGTHLDYHKPSDTADKVNYEGLWRITNYVGELVKSIDQNPTKPTYTVAKSATPPDTGRRTFNVTLGTIPGYADGNDGMLVEGVRDATPAAKSGIKAGDKIIKLAGKDIRNVQDYTAILGELKADVEYEIVIMRGTEKLILKITPAARK